MAIAHIEPQPTDKSPPGSDEPMRMYPISGGHFDSERHARCSRPTAIPRRHHESSRQNRRTDDRLNRNRASETRRYFDAGQSSSFGKTNGATLSDFPPGIASGSAPGGREGAT